MESVDPVPSNFPCEHDADGRALCEIADQYASDVESEQETNEHELAPSGISDPIIGPVPRDTGLLQDEDSGDSLNSSMALLAEARSPRTTNMALSKMIGTMAKVSWNFEQKIGRKDYFK